MSIRTLEVFKALVDGALKSQSLDTRQTKAGKILSEARKHLTRKEFQELESLVFEKLEKGLSSHNNLNIKHHQFLVMISNAHARAGGSL